MPLTPATLTVNFTSNYKGIHRICWRVQDSGDEYDCSLLTSCVGNGTTCSFNIPIVVDNEDCGEPVIYEGYIQPICNDITSEDGRLPFEIGYYPEDCPEDPCFNAPSFNCIIYSGDPILCGVEVVINTGDNLTTALTSLSDRICDIVDNNNYISNVELSGTDLIFTNDTPGTSPAFEGTIDFSSVIPSITADNGLGIDPVNNVQLGGTLLKQTIIDHAGLYDLIFKSATKTLDIFTIMGDSGRVGVWTDNPFTDQVKYASSVDYAFPFVVRTPNDRFGFSHNNGLVELGSYIFNPNAYFGTTTNHGLIWFTNDLNRGVITADGNFSFGTINDLSSRVGVQGIDSTSSNFATKILNSSSQEMFSVRNDGYSFFGKNLVGGTADLITIDPSDLSFGFGINGAWGSSEFLIRSTNTYNRVFNVRDNGGNNLFIVAKNGSDAFGNTWDNFASIGDEGVSGFMSNWKSATYGAGYYRLSLNQSNNDGLLSQTQDIWSAGSPMWLKFSKIDAYSDRYIMIDSIKNQTTPTDNTPYVVPFLELYSDNEDSGGVNQSGESRISSIGHSWVAVNTTGTSYGLGVGTKTPVEKIHSTAKIRADVAFNVNGTDGFTGTGAYTNFTIVGGIITNAS